MADEPQDKQPQDMVPDVGVVEKPFSSEYRRHRKGDPITRADLEKSHLDFDHLVESGFIVEQAPVEQPVVTPTTQNEKEPIR